MFKYKDNKVTAKQYKYIMFIEFAATNQQRKLAKRQWHNTSWPQCNGAYNLFVRLTNNCQLYLQKYKAVKSIKWESEAICLK